MLTINGMNKINLISVPNGPNSLIKNPNIENISAEIIHSILSGTFAQSPPSPFDQLRPADLQIFLRHLEPSTSSKVASIGVFDRSDGLLYIYPGENGDAGPPVIFSAGNETRNMAGDPYTVDSNGPAPNGTYPVQGPIYTGNSESFGPYYFPVGDCGTSPTCSGPQGGDIARKRGIGVHGGRTGYQRPTDGCIRLNNDDVRTLNEMNAADPLTKITIQD